MSRIPSYGEYERKGAGGPEGKCRTCGHQGPMYHSPTGYECDKCHSIDIVLKLKENKGWFDNARRTILAADAIS